MNEMLSDTERKSLRSTIAEEVRLLRIQRGMTQENLAKAIDVDRKTINRIEQGHSLPDSGILYSLADVFGVPADRLRKKLD